MEIDVLHGPAPWATSAELAATAQRVGFSGLVVTEGGHVPWMSLAAAARAAPELDLATGVAVAFARSPMVSASVAWELAEQTGGRFRLGLGSQVRAHAERRYAAEFDRPAARMADHVRAVKACFRAFAGEEPLSHFGEFHELSLLPPIWAPRRHDSGAPPVDISAVGPVMCRVAGEVADGVHVHPLHSTHYLEHRLAPAVAEGAARAGRDATEVALIVPVFTVVGDTPEERAPLLAAARTQLAFYGSTKNYAFQFEDLGFDGVSAELNRHLKAGDIGAMGETITDEILEHFAVVATWDDLADRLIERYDGTAARLVMYLTGEHTRRELSAWERWGEVARAVRTGSSGNSGRAGE